MASYNEPSNRMPRESSIRILEVSIKRGITDLRTVKWSQFMFKLKREVKSVKERKKNENLHFFTHLVQTYLIVSMGVLGLDR